MDDIPIAERRSPPSLRRSRSWVRWIGLVVAGGLLALGWWSWAPVPGDPVVATPPVALVAPPLPTASPASVLGHHAFQEAPAEELRPIGSYGGRTVKLRIRAAESFRRMAVAAQRQGIRLVPISGFRSVKDQEFLFFRRAQAKSLRPEERALTSAPPGYSEHHTGYAIDIGDGNFSESDVRTSFDQTPAFAWLQANAARFGFELSFPKGNAQGIAYEPWHWRFVGDRHSLETFYADQPRSQAPSLR